MSEAVTLQEIRLALGTRPDLRLFRNQVGGCIDRQGQMVRFGLCIGSGDLIGWRRTLITSDMVGTTVAIFASVEVKAPGGTHPVTPEQHAFIRAVEAAGGIAGVARSPAQALLALGLHPTVPA